MKKEIKIKPFFGTHQIYQEIVNYPPENVEYLGVSENIMQGKYYSDKRFKEKIGRFLIKFKIPRMIFIKPGEYNLIHSSRGIIPLNNKPWVMDVEHVFSFTSLNPDILKKKYIKKFIENRIASKNCKAILCHCEATRQAFFKFLDCNNFKNKLKLLYPASHLIPIRKSKHQKIIILCVLSIFYNKGGPQALEAFSRIEKKYKNVKLIMRADVPEELKKKYSSKNISYTPYINSIIPRDKLIKEVYSKADIFLYPTLTDSFGYSLIDAKIAKLPIIATNLFAGPEIVKDKKSGIIINIPGYNLKKEYRQAFPWKEMRGEVEEEFIKNMVNALENLIKSKRLRIKLGEAGYNEVKNGKFSIKERNKKLLEVYREAIK